MNEAPVAKTRETARVHEVVAGRDSAGGGIDFALVRFGEQSLAIVFSDGAPQGVFRLGRAKRDSVETEFELVLLPFPVNFHWSDLVLKSSGGHPHKCPS